ncbi:AN1-type zinc finger protein 4 isoform X1 [Lepisosteus oculatus]|uniref:AN1-type zinc finger protein 4 isoform X1 n=2 Tax=Lepisosteus oculatus TaxID=7918 RepID=UPI00073FC5C7|nr:PREDICTED: AN1-type zinc finger protein 4 isoform X1 [Lepisosteus oculatus]XP_015202227.1 PREDICTED: AN1-type zinc finger protein 4 isoform X1 [Lepisosteus oculatus]
MAHKKEPPFFNEDNVGPFHYKLPFYETMELFIETLTGTCFELRVSPFETVISVKAKIQRLEGIPVAQQHLIWNNVELEDEYCLNDYSITEGCTLKLVLAMRGGPINTRRVPMDDPVKEFAEYMDSNRDDVLEKTSPNKQVTFLVYQEGDQLNFFRVVDRGDGTLTPVSESISGGSVYNLYTEEEEESEPSPSGQQIMENSITMNKMKLLKTKMENMNLSKKPKKTAKVKPRPPICARPCTDSLNTARHQRLFRVLPQIGHSLNPSTCLPPVRDQHSSATPPVPAPPSALSSVTPASQAVLSSTCYSVKEDESWECPVMTASLSKIRSPPKVSRVKVDNSHLPKVAVLPPLSVLPNRESRDGSMEQVKSNIEGTVRREDAVLVGTHPDAFLVLDEEQANASVNAEPAQGKDSSSEMIEEATERSVAALLSKAVSSESMDTWALSTERLSQRANKALSPLQFPAQLTSNPLVIGKPQRLPKSFGYGSLRPTASRALLKSEEYSGAAEASPARTPKFRGVKVDSPGKHPEIISRTEARDITEMVNKASKEPLGSVSNLGILASLARSTSKESSLPGSCGLGRPHPAALPLPTNIHLFQDDLLRKVSPPEGAGASCMPANPLGSSGGSSNTIRRIGTPTYHLPPVKAPVAPKKKSSKHCFLCGKKTGLATSYECRCRNNFCATHRYAETHDCNYDYKTAGRRYLQESNPIISAPKLPKI